MKKGFPRVRGQVFPIEPDMVRYWPQKGTKITNRLAFQNWASISSILKLESSSYLGLHLHGQVEEEEEGTDVDANEDEKESCLMSR